MNVLSFSFLGFVLLNFHKIVDVCRSSTQQAWGCLALSSRAVLPQGCTNRHKQVP